LDITSIDVPVKRLPANCRKHIERSITMAEDKVQDYTDNTDEGHVDTREQNFDCEKPDKNLGCDLGIDVQG
jgi:hypothetical protein